MNFSDELNKYMELLNCSAKDICDISGLSPSLISRYLNNQRTPKVNSEYLEKIVDALYEISVKSNISLSKETIFSDLKSSIEPNEANYDTFVDNFITLQDDLSLSTVELSKAIGYDASFISRMRSKERKPADLESFIDKLCDYVFLAFQSEEKKQKLATLLECSVNDLNSNEQFESVLEKWIYTSHIDNNKNLINFLSKVDNFNLNDYIKTDFNKVKVPTSPVIFKNSKTFFGIEGRKKAEGEFLKTTLLSKSKEPIFFYSSLPMSKAGEDESFKQKWVLAMTMILKKGLHLNMVHNIDRPVNEMFLGLESWIPIYMSGSISPYYFENPPHNLFSGSHCTSGSVALSSECIKNNEKNTRFYLTTKKEEVKFEQEKSKYMLSKAKPLMKIYKENDKSEFETFMKNQKSSDITKIEKDIFKNIDFCINKDKWIMINKKTSPEIHFVIYNKKLMKSIENFLSN